MFFNKLWREKKKRVFYWANIKQQQCKSSIKKFKAKSNILMECKMKNKKTHIHKSTGITRKMFRFKTGFLSSAFLRIWGQRIMFKRFSLISIFYHSLWLNLYHQRSFCDDYWWICQSVCMFLLIFFIESAVLPYYQWENDWNTLYFCCFSNSVINIFVVNSEIKLIFVKYSKNMGIYFLDIFYVFS